MTRVVVHVDRLVLRGLSHGERDIVAAVGERLQRTFGSPATLQQFRALGQVPRLSLGRIGPRPARDGTR